MHDFETQEKTGDGHFTNGLDVPLHDSSSGCSWYV